MTVSSSISSVSSLHEKILPLVEFHLADRSFIHTCEMHACSSNSYRILRSCKSLNPTPMHPKRLQLSCLPPPCKGLLDAPLLVTADALCSVVELGLLKPFAQSGFSGWCGGCSDCGCCWYTYAHVHLCGSLSIPLCLYV